MKRHHWTPNWVLPWACLKPVLGDVEEAFLVAHPDAKKKKVRAAFQRLGTGCWLSTKLNDSGWMAQALGRDHFTSALWFYDRDVMSSVINFMAQRDVIEIYPPERDRVTGYRPKNPSLVAPLKPDSVEPIPRPRAHFKKNKKVVATDFSKGRGDRRAFDRRNHTVKLNEELNGMGWALPVQFLEAYIEARTECDPDWSIKDNHLLQELRVLPTKDGLIELGFLARQHTSYQQTTHRGGRICNGFQQFPRELRRCLRRNGGPVVEVDFDQLNPTVLSILCGEEIEGDAYSIPGVPRAMAKKVFNAFLSAKDRRSGLAGVSRKKPPVCPTTMLRLLRERNPWLVDQFFKSRWDILQAIESSACARVLAHFNKRKKGCISIHDCHFARA